MLVILKLYIVQELKTYFKLQYFLIIRADISSIKCYFVIMVQKKLYCYLL